MEITDQMHMVPIRQIKPYHKNVRKNDLTVEKLVELIPKTGFNVPLVLDRQNIIVKGHSRWRAAIRLGMKTLPVVYTDADEETIKLDRLADNRVQEFSAWDDDALALELNMLKPTFGFELAALDFRMLPPEDPPGPEDDEEDDDDEPIGDAEGDALVATSTPPPGPAPSSGEDGEALTEPEYMEVVCDQCGTRLRVERSAL